MTLPIDSHKIAAARLWAVTKLPYLASALFASKVVAQAECLTIAVDTAWNIHADPSIVESLSVEDLGKLFIHLAGHLLRDHADRAKALRVNENGDRATWNRATDAEINDDLARDGCVPRVAPDVPTDMGCDDGHLAEAYFTQATPGPRHWDCGSGCDGFDRPWEKSNGMGNQLGVGNQDGMGNQQAHLLRLGVANEVQRHHARHPGTVAGG
ncbi:MAG: DUF2201 family putative metallopeptidase, partial [Acidimicrobiales bacterium]